MACVKCMVIFFNIKNSQLYNGMLNDYFFNKGIVWRWQDWHEFYSDQVYCILGVCAIAIFWSTFFLCVCVCFIKKICLCLYNGLSKRTRSVLSVDRTTVVNTLNRCYSSRHSNNTFFWLKLEGLGAPTSTTHFFYNTPTTLWKAL